MRQNLTSNRLENMFSSLTGNSYNSATNIRIMENDLKTINHDLDFDYDNFGNKRNKIKNSIHREDIKNTPVKNARKSVSKRNLKLADSIIEKLKLRESPIKPLNTDRSNVRSMASTFYQTIKNKKSRTTIQDNSKCSTFRSSQIASKTTLQTTIHTERPTITLSNYDVISPRSLGKKDKNLKTMLKQTLNNITKDINFKQLQFVNIKDSGNKVTKFKDNSRKNDFLIRDYTMGLNSVENSKRNMEVTQNFYDNIKKKKRQIQKNEMKIFYRNKFGDNIITDESISDGVKLSDDEDENDYDKMNLKFKKYFKVKFSLKKGENKRQI